MLKQLLHGLFGSGGSRRDVQRASAPSRDSAFDADIASRLSRGLHARIGDNEDLERWAGLTPEAKAALEQRLAAECLGMLFEHGSVFAAADRLFEDAASRELFRSLLCFRILGPGRIAVPIDAATHWARRGAAAALRTGDSPHAGTFGGVSRFDLQFEGEHLSVDAWAGNIAWTFLLRQYWFERGAVKIMPMPGDCIIDAGACFGDTALAFASGAGDPGSVHAFEIDPANLAVAQDNLAQNPRAGGRVRLNPLALGSEAGTLYRHGSGPGAQVRADPGGEPVEVTTLDAYADARQLGKVDFIKMDIEGAEMDALLGAKETLIRHRPRLAISLYHRAADLARIPVWINRLDLGYRFWLEHYTIHHEETVLFAAAD